MQTRQKIRRIDAGGIIPGRGCVRANVSHAAEIGPMQRALGWLVHGDQVDLGRPRCLRQPGRFVPKIGGLVEQDFEPRTRRDHQYAAWIIHDRHPGLEMWVNLETIVLVVQELGGRRARMNDQGIKAARRERVLRAPHERLQMRLIKLIETGYAHISSYLPKSRLKYAPDALAAIDL